MWLYVCMYVCVPHMWSKEVLLHAQGSLIAGVGFCNAAHHDQLGDSCCIVGGEGMGGLMQRTNDLCFAVSSALYTCILL